MHPRAAAHPHPSASDTRSPRRVRRAAAVLAATSAVVLTAVPAASATAHGTDGPVVPTVVSATPDTALDSRFTAYGNSGDGWTGADSTWSARLPGGRELFMFSDTFLPPITAPTRPTDAPLVHNSFVQIDRHGHMSTILGGTAAAPDSVISSTDPTHWYWLGAGVYLGGVLQVPVTEWRKTGSGQWDFALVGSSLARFSPRDLHTPLSVTPLPRAQGVEWGQWVFHEHGYTYVYGVEDLGTDKYLHIARVHGTDLRAPWEFFTGRSGDAAWSSTETDSTRVMDYVAPELSIHRLRPHLYMMTTQDGSELFSNHLVAYFATSPTGPFTNKTPLYTTPETGASGSYGNANIITYNAHVHTELSTAHRLVISYNVNSLDSTIGGDLYRDVSIYRPRFIDVTLRYPDERH